MRLRSCILLASSTGAGGALLLAADMYRRIQVAETASLVAGRAGAGEFSTFFGMVQVLGLIALAFLFLTIFLLTAFQARSETPPPVVAGVAEPPVEVVPDAADTKDSPQSHEDTKEHKDGQDGP
jgi:hypothetical protein